MNDRWHILEFETLPSTNDLLVEYDDPVPVFCIAREQLAGRGRHDRTWASPPGGLYASFCVRDTVAAEDGGWIPLLTGVAAAGTLREFGVEAVLKWPNDLLVNGKKIGGILSRSVKRGSGTSYIVGTGINVNNDPPLEGTTSVREELGRDVDLEEFTTTFVNNVADLIASLPEELGRLREEYVGMCSTVGRDVTVETKRGSISGRAIGIGEDGALMLDTGKGTERILSGDCIHAD